MKVSLPNPREAVRRRLSRRPVSVPGAVSPAHKGGGSVQLRDLGVILPGSGLVRPGVPKGGNGLVASSSASPSGEWIETRLVEAQVGAGPELNLYIPASELT